ncbi:MAG: M61 family metallopeptidase [Spirosoma sp.]|nr:M61 family metallopeptidase [Spirosoma sp.]
MKKHTQLLYLLTVWTLLTSLSVKARPRPVSSETPLASAPAITYILSMPEPQTHYFEVEMQLRDLSVANAKKNGYVDVRMPVWTPGSYLIREYAKNVEAFTAMTGGKAVRSEKVRKDTWRVYSAADILTVRYRVYANELTVRTSFIDIDHGYVTPASMFMYVDALKDASHRVVVQPYKAWNMVTTGLRTVGKFTYEAPNYDIVVDSPIEIGNQTMFSFTAAGVPHRVAMYGLTNYDSVRLAADYIRICEAAKSVVGEHPCQDYTFIVHHIPQGGGGLEHLNSTTLETSPRSYETDGSYRRFFNLVAHEYFHLWNVKRIRPIALGPFDYSQENYTHLLWLSEGGTSFYADYIQLRAGMYTPANYVEVVANDINQIENQPGNFVQSTAESSFDAWIKGYRPNENSGNTTISYYSKGAVLTSLLNLAIIVGSNGQRTIDDLIRLLYNEYYKKLNRGFTDEEFRRAAEQVAARKLDDFFEVGVNSANPINYDAYFAPVGLKLVNAAVKSQDGFLGAATRTVNGKVYVSGVRRGSAAYVDGLNVGDEVMAVDGVPVGSDLQKLINDRKVGNKLTFQVSRSGLPKEVSVTLTASPYVSYRLEPLPTRTDAQKTLYNKWLFIK